MRPTTSSSRSAASTAVVGLNDLVREAGLHEGADDERGSLVADLDAIGERLAGREDLLVESHLAHHLDVDRVAVLRCHPEELYERLCDRGEPAATAEENAEAEALDVVLSAAVEAHGLEAIYEIDTSDRSPAAVAAEIEAVVAGDREPSAGEVTFVDYL